MDEWSHSLTVILGVNFVVFQVADCLSCCLPLTRFQHELVHVFQILSAPRGNEANNDPEDTFAKNYSYAVRVDASRPRTRQRKLRFVPEVLNKRRNFMG